MIEDGGRLLFSGIDVAFALGYAKTKKCDKCSLQGGPETVMPVS